MKLLSLLTFVFFVSVTANSYSQQTKFNMNVEKISVKEAFQTIEAMSEYIFIYSEDNVDLDRKVNIRLENESVNGILDELFKGTDNYYEIQDRQVVILFRDAEKESKPVLLELTIVDEADSPLPGATVVIVGKSQGVITDSNGSTSLWVERGSKIVISFLGMEQKEMTVDQPMNEKVVLKGKTSEINQIVVTGYTQTTMKRTTGSVSIIKGKDLDMQSKPAAGLDMLLQGKLAGVNIKAVSGRPGETATVRIRGTNTITGNADPLWVVDGVPLQKDIPSISGGQIKSGDFNDIFTNGISGINPNDIESVTVLKDASAAAIYGSRAAGGVIVVTTKRGKSGRMQINYSSNVSVVSKPPRDVNLMNSPEKLSWEQELWDEFSAEDYNSVGYYPIVGVVGMIHAGEGKYAGMSASEQDAEISQLSEETTNWFEELFRNSVSQSHFLSLSGGADKNTYYVSLGYNNNEGVVKKSGYDSYSVSAKLDLKPNDRVSIGFSSDLSMQESTGFSGNVDPFEYAYFANPYEKAYNEDGSYAADNTYFMMTEINGGYRNLLPEEGFNILREMNETSSKTKNLSTTIIGTISVKLQKGLKFEGLGSWGYVTNNSDNINGKNSYAAWQDRPFEGGNRFSPRKYASISQFSAYNANYNLRGQFNYSSEFGENHYLNALIGSELRGQYAKSIYTKRYGYDPVTGNFSMPALPETSELEYGDLLHYATLIDGLSGQSIGKDAFASFYFSADYSYKHRYVASLTARTDGSNNFGSNQQFNPTGSFGVSWNVDQERFMKKYQSIISHFSLRAAIGYTGNINKSVFPQLMMNYESSFRKTESDYFRMGTIRNAPNPNLRWEKTRDLKFSLDVGFLDDRINLQAEVYSRHTYDAVTSEKVPASTGFIIQSFNTSELLNRGLELTLSAIPVKTKNWRMSFSTNIAYNMNKLVSYNPGSFDFSTSTHVGYPLGAVFSGKINGINPNLGIYTYKPRPDAVFETAKDRTKSENYIFYLGTSNAPTTGGYSISTSYKKLSLSVGGTYSIGGKVMNEIAAPYSGGSIERHKSVEIPTQENDLYVNHFNVRKDAVNRWTPSNPITNAHPRILDAFGDVLDIDDYMPTTSAITNASLLENVSYFKLGSVMLAYSFEGEWMKKCFINNLSLSVAASNLFIITNYSGIDPETPGAVYPMARTYTLGLSVGF